MGYPWNLGDKLTFTDLNAAITLCLGTAQTAQTTATTAQTAANAAAAGQAVIRPFSVTVNWPAIVVTNGTYVLSATLPYALVVTSVDASIGSAGGALLATFRSNGLAIGNLAGLVVSGVPKTNTLAVAGPSNPLAVGAGSLLDVVVAVSTGTPADAYLCLNGYRTS